MKVKLYFFSILLLLPCFIAHAQAIRNLSGFTTTVFGANDDGTYPCTGPDDGIPPGTPVAVPIGFNINFYGNVYSNLYVNNNGNVTFQSPLGDFTPFGLVGTASQIIAPFFADVDTRTGNVVTFGNDVVDGHQAFGVNWIGVGYYDEKLDKLDSFQLVIIDRSDRNPGDFDIEFNYDQVQWETGDASGGTDGLGGSSAVVGFSNGTGLPGTSLQLSGSAVPGALLDVNPGGLVHNYLNSDPCGSETNVPGRYVFSIVNLTNTVLNVQRFSQGNSQWAANSYANSSFTIQQKGCALSSLAMALKYAGVTTDPGALNTLMEADGDFAGNSVIWDAATRDASSHTLEFHPHRTSDTEYLSQALACGYPVIAGVNLNNQGSPTHFVLVTGEQNGHFLINDPGHVDATTLDYYNNNFETRGYVADPAGDISGLDIVVGNASDLLVVNPLGQKTGNDPASGSIVEQIPQSVHFDDCLEDNDLTGTPGTNTIHIVQIYEPVQGTYQMFLTGASPGAYPLSLRSWSQAGGLETPLNLQETNLPNTLTTFQFYLGPSGVASEPFTNQYAWSVSPTNGAAPLAVQFEAPAVDSGGNVVTNWYWTFGDSSGSVSTGQSPSYTYNTGGTFFPGVTIINANGTAEVSYGPSIFIPSIPFSANLTNGLAPLNVQFASSNLDTAGNAIASWSWDFGDGNTGTDQNPSHTYTNAGTFKVTLAAVNNLGQQIPGVGPSITVTNLPFLGGLVVNGGFETGDFTGWNLSGGDPFDNFVDDGSLSGIAPHSGSFLAALGSIGSLSYLSQTLPTSPGQSYILSCWLNSPDGATPNEFMVSWGGTTLFDEVDIPAIIGWTNLQFTVPATASATVLEFGFEDDTSLLGLDDISVFSASPVISKPAYLSNGQFQMTVNASAGQTCTVQMATSLLSQNWTSLLVTNSVPGPFLFTDPHATNRQRYYRILVP